ncbi:hypothetical protein Tco_0082932, partial [Tanacetum coccineum]
MSTSTMRQFTPTPKE